jgi:hypothetical protein
MARAKILSTKIRSWDLLNESVKPVLVDMPQVQPLQVELQGLLDSARSLDSEQEEMRSKLRDIVFRRKEVERRGEIVRRRVEAHLRGTYGYTAEQLIKHGVKPRPRVIRRKKDQPKETPSVSTAESPPVAKAEAPQETPPAE